MDAARGADVAQENLDAQRGQSLGQGFRLASELIAAVIVGLGLGLGLDALTGAAPFGLLAGLFLGFGAGLRNAIQAFGKPDETDDEEGATRAPNETTGEKNDK